MEKFLKEVKEYLIIIVIAFVASIILNTFVFSISTVRESSMEPTLIGGDTVIVSRMAYWFKEPEVGDIIVLLEGNDYNMGPWARMTRLVNDVINKFKGIENRDRLVKRIIGMPGDEIDIKDGLVYVNGQVIDAEYIDVPTDGRTYLSYPVVVPQDQVFVLGDNRPVSRDGRSFGFVDMENIEGKITFRFFPFGKIGFMY